MAFAVSFGDEPLERIMKEGNISDEEGLVSEEGIAKKPTLSNTRRITQNASVFRIRWIRLSEGLEEPSCCDRPTEVLQILH
jgi:hypothetical protein